MLAHWGEVRLAALPDVPTLKELGSDVEYAQWSGLFVPAGTPEPVVARLREAARAAANDAKREGRAPHRRQPGAVPRRAGVPALRRRGRGEDERRGEAHRQGRIASSVERSEAAGVESGFTRPRRAMAELLSLPGRPALSPFRVAKLRKASPKRVPATASPRSPRRYWHFVEIDASARRGRARDARPPADLRPARTTTRGDGGARARRRAAPRHDLAVVVEGDRHRAQLRARRRDAHRARRRLPRRRRATAPLARRRPRGAAAARCTTA